LPRAEPPPTLKASLFKGNDVSNTNAPSTVQRADALDRALQFGPAMRVQRLTEAAFMVAAIFAQDVRFAYVTFVLTLVQALSPRWAPVAQVVVRVVRARSEHRIGDMYFDLGGIRGASAVSVLGQGVGIALVWSGYDVAGFIVLAMPTASFLMAPTLGFCAGCWFYVLGRDWFVRRGWLRRDFDEFADIAIARGDAPDQPQLPA
jgi:hypothetical protein